MIMSDLKRRGWISSKKQLPPKGSIVLGWFADGPCNGWMDTTAFGWESDGWDLGEPPWDEPPTHWRYLPKPPKAWAEDYDE